MLGIANPTDLKSANFSSKYIIGQYSVASKNDKIKAYLNFQAGKPNETTKVSQVDLVVTGAISDKFSIGLANPGRRKKQTDFRRRLRRRQHLVRRCALSQTSIRFPGWALPCVPEYFSDDDQLNVFSTAAAGGNIIATTLSANFKVDNLTFIPEIRFEKASEELYLDSSGLATDASTTFLLAAVYKF